jgi:hypothetical protein
MQNIEMAMVASKQPCSERLGNARPGWVEEISCVNLPQASWEGLLESYRQVFGEALEPNRQNVL